MTSRASALYSAREAIRFRFQGAAEVDGCGLRDRGLKGSKVNLVDDGV